MHHRHNEEILFCKSCAGCKPTTFSHLVPLNTFYIFFLCFCCWFWIYEFLLDSSLSFSSFLMIWYHRFRIGYLVDDLYVIQNPLVNGQLLWEIRYYMQYIHFLHTFQLFDLVFLETAARYLIYQIFGGIQNLFYTRSSLRWSLLLNMQCFW